MRPCYVICHGGDHAGERYPLPHDVDPGFFFAWDEADREVYPVMPQTSMTNYAPMWVRVLEAPVTLVAS